MRYYLHLELSYLLEKMYNCVHFSVYKMGPGSSFPCHKWLVDFMCYNIDSQGSSIYTHILPHSHNVCIYIPSISSKFKVVNERDLPFSFAHTLRLLVEI